MSIQAIYEIKRQGFLIGYIQHPDRFDDALAYAYEHRLAPIFHEVIMREEYGEDPFSEAYSVKADFASEVTDYIDKLWRQKKFSEMAFYSLEERFGGYQSNRLELLQVIEYARISGRFDDAAYDAIASNAPSEANNIATSFSVDDIYFS